MGMAGLVAAFALLCYIHLLCGSGGLDHLLSFLAFTQGWGTDPANFFFKTYLQLSDTPFAFNGIRWPILGAILCAWFVCWVVLFNGVKKGIEVAGKIFMPLLFIMVLVITARAVNLEGAKEGLNWMFTPIFRRF